MGFKADTSFLKFLTMGARGVHQTMSQLEEAGFRPIELERYCGSNKIWATKVKRLRLPDLLCIKTGMRVEVRAKSDLKIRMSDAPSNPDRVWDAGLRDRDVVAFIACQDSGDGPVPFDKAVFFTVDELRKSVASSKLGPPKSASEGAERDRTWPASTPSRDGRVLEVTTEKIVAEMFATSEQKARNQTFPLKEKVAYVRPGDTFKAGGSFLSGAPASLTDLPRDLEESYDPFPALQSDNPVDRYAAVKSLRFLKGVEFDAAGALEQLIPNETDQRVRLEAAGSAAILGSSLGQDTIAEFIWSDHGSSELRMEAVLILTELGQVDFARDLLKSIAVAEKFSGNEIRQAAIWGLGKAGLKSYEDLLPFMADPEENVILHTIAAFGRDVPDGIIQRLVENLHSGDKVVAPAASEALRQIGTESVLQALMQAYENPAAQNWVLATLGRMPPKLVRERLKDREVLAKLEPMLLFAPGANWLSSEEMNINVSFLLKQNI